MNMLAVAFSFAARDGLVAVAYLYTDVCENERNEASFLSFSHTSVYRYATATKPSRAANEKATASIFITHFPIFLHIQLHRAILVLG